MINIALPKGRLGEKVYSLLKNCGYGCREYEEGTRKLVFRDSDNGVGYFWVKPSDVPVYVQLGAADVGFAGKDILDEYSADVYEILDLKMGVCNMCVAAKTDFADDLSRPLKVATKFPNTAARHFGAAGREIEVIKLNGSIELGPVLGISDVIVDIVETGKTLNENNLKVIEKIAPISTRLIVGKAAYKFKRTEIDGLLERLKGEIEK